MQALIGKAGSERHERFPCLLCLPKNTSLFSFGAWVSRYDNNNKNELLETLLFHLSRQAASVLMQLSLSYSKT